MKPFHEWLLEQNNEMSRNYLTDLADGKAPSAFDSDWDLFSYLNCRRPRRPGTFNELLRDPDERRELIEVEKESKRVWGLWANTFDNMNHLRIRTDVGEDESLKDHSVISDVVEVYFKDLEYHLVRKIREADIVVGCVAWLTHMDILGALSRLTAASIIVQKEDFLRPDSKNLSMSDIRNAYNKVPYWSRMGMGGVLGEMSVCGDPTIQGVRCVGAESSGQKKAHPRMHHKFLVFCKHEPDPGAEIMGIMYPNVSPYAVWTGSFNFTYNAERSFENAVVLQDHKAVWAYFQEYLQVAALSEPLDYEHPWIEPEWRIGT